MDERNNDFDFDFTPIGLAIKKARTAQGMTREQLARIVDYDPRHLQAIENEGQKPSLELFIQLVTMFNISVDEYFPRNKCSWCFRLRQQLRFPSQAQFHHFVWGLLKHRSSRRAALSAQEALQTLIFSSSRPPLRLHYTKNSGSPQRYKPICSVFADILFSDSLGSS